MRDMSLSCRIWNAGLGRFGSGFRSSEGSQLRTVLIATVIVEKPQNGVRGGIFEEETFVGEVSVGEVSVGEMFCVSGIISPV